LISKSRHSRDLDGSKEDNIPLSNFDVGWWRDESKELLLLSSLWMEISKQEITPAVKYWLKWCWVQESCSQALSFSSGSATRNQRRKDQRRMPNDVHFRHDHRNALYRPDTPSVPRGNCTYSPLLLTAHDSPRSKTPSRREHGSFGGFPTAQNSTKMSYKLESHRTSRPVAKN
jgi:hypothetical protein